MISDFKAVAFRAFASFYVPDLRRLNLVVGRNSVGKSTLLESLHVYAAGGSVRSLDALLRRRGEFQPSELDSPRRPSVSWGALFHDWAPQTEIVLGPTNGPEVGISITRLNENGQQPIPGFEAVEGGLAASLALQVTINGAIRTVMPLDDEYHFPLRRVRFEEDPHSLLPTQIALARTDPLADLSDKWDNIVLTGLEEDVLNALRLLDERVERLTFIRQGASEGREPVVKLRGTEAALPIRTLGDGMSRVLQIVLGFVNSKAGIFLVDEIENGIHYTAQPRLLDLLARLAADLDIQVFATTHSWDAVIAFQEALAGRPGEGTLIRLDATPEGTRAVTLDSSEVAVATRESIEIR